MSRYKKPLIILKSGKTKSGMKAASSHTGALSSNEKITDALLKQFGVIRANSMGEMFNTAKGFEHFPRPKGTKIVVVTNAGGPGILAVDKLEQRNLQLAEISDSTKTKLKEYVHPEGSVNNPVDLLPGGTPDIYKKVNNIILEDDKVDAIISIFVEPVMVEAFEVIEAVNSIKSDKPIYQVCMPLPEFWSKYSDESDYKIPIFRNPEDPADVISNILHYEDKKDKNIRFDKTITESTFTTSVNGFLNQKNVEKLCNAYEIPYVKSNLVKINEIINYDKLNFPLVVKGLSSSITHKSELHAVKLNIHNQDDLKNAVEEIRKSFASNGIKLEHILIQPYLDVKHELLIGGYRDPSFGPVVLFGNGGKYVEILNDTKIRSAYLHDSDIDEMINETRIGQIIKGVRGEKGVNINELKKVIRSVASMMIENNKIVEIDINPLVVDDKFNFCAVDVRINLAK